MEFDQLKPTIENPGNRRS